MNRLLLGPYALLWRAARPILRRHKRLKDGFSLRLAPAEWGGFLWGEEGADIWVQAASGGESFLARQLLGEVHALCTAKPQQKLRILCTSCTRQGLDVLEAAREYALTAWPRLDIAVRVFPLDEPAAMRRALALARPRAVALLETELWPGLMAAAAEGGIPLLVLNGRMTEKSYSAYRFLNPFWRGVAPARVLAMADEDASRFAGLFGRERVGVMPNMKFDGVPEEPPIANAASPAFALLPGPAPAILLASVREEEEPLLAPVIADLREKATHAVIVVAPRHMERVAAWRQTLAETIGETHCVLRSDLDARGESAKPGQVVVWDRFGELTALYARADAVFVGGSLAPLGGQNFLEAAGQGKIPVIGPHWKNFAWVGEGFFAAGLGVRVSSPGELAPALLRAAADAPDATAVRERVNAYVASRRGGTRIAADAVWGLIHGGRGTP